MAGSRTIKTLVALLVAMTFGAFALMLLESDPIRPTANSLAAVSVPRDDSNRFIRETANPLRFSEWRNVIIHTSADETSDVAQRCHFVVESNGAIARTPLWDKQQYGRHVSIPGANWNSNSIGVVIAGRKPNAAQSESLRRLLLGLRDTFDIPEAQVYTHSQLNGGPCGASLPE
jgi:hypothetical protein